MENKSDADTLCEMSYIEVGNEKGNFAYHARKFKQKEFNVRVDRLPRQNRRLRNYLINLVMWSQCTRSGPQQGRITQGVGAEHLLL